jgi:uncharacterized protein
VKRAVLVLLVLLGVFVGVILAFQRRLIYLPTTGPLPRAETVIATAKDVELQTSDGLVLGAWLVKPLGRPNDFTILVANGNAGDRSLRAPLAQALAEAGFVVLLFDYRGYGDNPGSPSEDALALDVRAAYRFLIQDENVEPQRIIFFGESLGSAVVTELATEHRPGGLLLRSPFTDLAAVGQVHYPFLPVSLLLRDRFPLIDHISRVDVPTTVVYGTHDSIVPPEHSRTVAEAAAGPTNVVAIEANHNDPALLDGDELIDAVVALAKRIQSG